MKLLTIIAFQFAFAGVFAKAIHAPRVDQDDTLNSCDGVNLGWGLRLHAMCFVLQKDGEWIESDTSIDLNDCIANIGGTMVGAAEGHFGKSCNNIKVQRERNDSPITLNATCKGFRGKVDASIKLDFIKNINGRISCFHIGGESSLPM
ncbi:hypothetical protein F4782DRAFT_535264 [Xylaria castorea]|nr:hypothetical protein F4782DRAFT_535264 [Xylaria castorea]